MTATLATHIPTPVLIGAGCENTPAMLGRDDLPPSFTAMGP